MPAYVVIQVSEKGWSKRVKEMLQQPLENTNELCQLTTTICVHLGVYSSESDCTETNLAQMRNEQPEDVGWNHSVQSFELKRTDLKTLLEHARD